MANFGRTVKNNNYGKYTRTENDAVALRTTSSPLLDMFAMVGACRGQTEKFINAHFEKALYEDTVLATKLMFYARNIRGGLGERDTFRTMVRYMAEKHPNIMYRNIKNIPHFGRWDDLYALVGTSIEPAMWTFMLNQFHQDRKDMREGKPISLLAKWMKSVNTSSQESRELGKLTAKKLGLSEKTYRKEVARLRKYLRVVERKMSANEWEDINFEAVPSGAMKNYRNAFKRHVEGVFDNYMTQVESGEKEIKANLYPYEILMRAGICGTGGWGAYRFSIGEDRVLEAQWKALPNYISGKNNVIVMADTSDSMTSENGRPIATAIGLAIYFAERNRGPYKDLFMTFSEKPRFVELTGNTLKEKVECIESEVANTNLEAGLDLILRVALENNVSQDEMPVSLVVISDMHFDRAVCGSPLKTFYQSMKEKFEKDGYNIPTIIFWNTTERKEAFHVGKDDANVMLVSGNSTSTFKNILGNIGRTPFDFMIETLNDPQYDCVEV